MFNLTKFQKYFDFEKRYLFALISQILQTSSKFNFLGISFTYISKNGPFN